MHYDKTHLLRAGKGYDGPEWELSVAWPDDGACAQRAGFTIIYTSRALAEADAVAWLEKGAESATITGPEAGEV